MKGIFVLAGLAAVLIWLSMPSGSEAQPPDMTNEASRAFTVRVEGPGGTLSGPPGRSPDICFVNDAGDVECLFTLRREAPPVGYRLYWGAWHVQHVDGDEWCNLQVQRGGRDATTEGCVWGTGHVYVLVVTIGAAGDVGADYTHERQIWYLGTIDGVPQYGPVGGDQTTVLIDKDCRETVKQWREDGKVGPAPECRARTYRYDQGKPLVVVE